jgi:hypothetical protein
MVWRRNALRAYRALLFAYPSEFRHEYGDEMERLFAMRLDTKTSLTKTFYERYNSIARGEYRAAVDRAVPIYVLIERPVYAEYETYLKNKGNREISYAHVDSVNIFGLVEDILGQARNNPIQQFDKYSEIESWLREQWAGLFRELEARSESAHEFRAINRVRRVMRPYLEVTF